MHRLVVQREGPFYFSGESPDGLGWTGKRDRATKFQSQNEAESYAILISLEDPALFGKLVVVDLDEWERQNAKHG